MPHPYCEQVHEKVSSWVLFAYVCYCNQRRKFYKTASEIFAHVVVAVSIIKWIMKN